MITKQVGSLGGPQSPNKFIEYAMSTLIVLMSTGVLGFLVLPLGVFYFARIASLKGIKTGLFNLVPALAFVIVTSIVSGDATGFVLSYIPTIVFYLFVFLIMYLRAKRSSYYFVSGLIMLPVLFLLYSGVSESSLNNTLGGLQEVSNALVEEGKKAAENAQNVEVFQGLLANSIEVVDKLIAFPTWLARLDFLLFRDGALVFVPLIIVGLASLFIIDHSFEWAEKLKAILKEASRGRRFDGEFLETPEGAKRGLENLGELQNSYEFAEAKNVESVEDLTTTLKKAKEGNLRVTLLFSGVSRVAFLLKKRLSGWEMARKKAPFGVMLALLSIFMIAFTSDVDFLQSIPSALTLPYGLVMVGSVVYFIVLGLQGFLKVHQAVPAIIRFFLPIMALAGFLVTSQEDGGGPFLVPALFVLVSLIAELVPSLSVFKKSSDNS